MKSDSKFGVERKGKEIDKAQLADLEKIEFDVFQNLADTIQEDFENEKKPGQSFIDWLQSKPDDYFKRIELKDGGKIIQFSDYFEFGKTVASLTDAEKEVVNNLLRLSMGKED